MVGTEPTAFSPLNPSKDLSFISLNLYFRLSSVSVLLMPQQITLCSNEAAEFKTINLLLTEVLSCTSNKSVFKFTYACVVLPWRRWPRPPLSSDKKCKHPLNLCGKWHHTHWPVAEPNCRLACLLQFRKHWASLFKADQCLVGEEAVTKTIKVRSQGCSEAGMNWFVREPDVNIFRNFASCC